MDNKWDLRFLRLAKEIAEWSKDPTTKVGCVVVDKNNHPKTWAYNGFPRTIADSHERLTNRVLKNSIVQHCEANAVSNCAHIGTSMRNCSIYVTHVPCASCAGQLIQAGISKVVIYTSSNDPGFLERWKDSNENALALFRESGVEVLEL